MIALVNLIKCVTKATTDPGQNRYVWEAVTTQSNIFIMLYKLLRLETKSEAKTEQNTVKHSLAHVCILSQHSQSGHVTTAVTPDNTQNSCHDNYTNRTTG